MKVRAHAECVASASGAGVAASSSARMAGLEAHAAVRHLARAQREGGRGQRAHVWCGHGLRQHAVEKECGRVVRAVFRRPSSASIFMPKLFNCCCCCVADCSALQGGRNHHGTID